MKTRNRLIAEALGGALFLSACGGGGGGSSTPANPQTPASVDVTVTPSLGKFSTGCSVELRTGSGTLLGSAPITDAGTYADDRYAAISCTGSGEMFIRAATAYDVCARMAYAGQSLHEAAHAAIF